MTVKELIEKLSTFAPNSQVLIQFLNGDALGSAWQDTEIFDEDDVKLTDMPNLCDAFYIGGTKNGAMLGEALVVINADLKRDFRFSIKQNGGMYAKGFVAGIQFETLFTENLYFEILKNNILFKMVFISLFF